MALSGGKNNLSWGSPAARGFTPLYKAIGPLSLSPAEHATSSASKLNSSSISSHYGGGGNVISGTTPSFLSPQSQTQSIPSSSSIASELSMFMFEEEKSGLPMSWPDNLGLSLLAGPCETFRHDFALSGVADVSDQAIYQQLVEALCQEGDKWQSESCVVINIGEKSVKAIEVRRAEPGVGDGKRGFVAKKSSVAPAPFVQEAIETSKGLLSVGIPVESLFGFMEEFLARCCRSAEMLQAFGGDEFREHFTASSSCDSLSSEELNDIARRTGVAPGNLPFFLSIMSVIESV